MRYLGGKHFQARAYVGHLINEIGTVYVEPFAGGFNTAAELVRQRSPFRRHVYSDLMADTVELHRAVMDRYEPQPVSRERFNELKAGSRGALEAHAIGLLQTFSGKRWGAYVPTDALGPHDNETRFNAACNGLKRSAGALKSLQGLSLAVGPYTDLLIPDGAVVYCDPPYASTAGYNTGSGFDSAAFWIWANELAKRCTVYVSEYTVPGDWEVIYSQDRLASVATNNATAPRLELLVRKSPIPSAIKRVLSSSGLTAGAGQLAMFS